MNKGFILLDALLGVFIVCSISTISINIYFNYKNYQSGLIKHKEEINEEYKAIFESVGKCELCIIENKDLSRLEEY